MNSDDKVPLMLAQENKDNDMITLLKRIASNNVTEGRKKMS
jgi:hypothetical protein